MSKYYLFLDDERKPHKVTWVNLPENVEWIIAKSYNEFVKIINQQGVPYFVTFDHDLADEHYQEYFNSVKNGKFNYKNLKEKTGYDCAKFLIEHCMDKNLPLPLYEIHTMNPIGKANIQGLFNSFNKINNI